MSGMNIILLEEEAHGSSFFPRRLVGVELEVAGALHPGRVPAAAELEVDPAVGARVDQGERGRGTEETCVEGEVGRGLAGERTTNRSAESSAG